MMSMPADAELRFERASVGLGRPSDSNDSARTAAVQPLNKMWPTKPCPCSARDGLGYHRSGPSRHCAPVRQSARTAASELKAFTL